MVLVNRMLSGVQIQIPIWIRIRIQIQPFLSYLFREFIDAGIADPLSRSWTIQPEGTPQIGLSPGGSDGIFDGIEDGRCQKKRRLAHGL